jgi:hypothetical protein
MSSENKKKEEPKITIFDEAVERVEKKRRGKKKRPTIIKERPEGYFVGSEKDGTMLTDFLIKVHKKIHIKNKLVLIVDIIRNGIPEVEGIPIQGDVLNDMKKFKDFFQRWVVHGSGAMLSPLKEHVLSQDAVIAQGVDFTGIVEHEGAWVYVGNSRTTNAEGDEVPTLTLMNSEISVFSDIEEKACLRKEQATELFGHLFSYNERARAITIILWALACFLNPRLWKLGIKFPHLEATGEAGCGKTETQDSVVMSLFSTKNKTSCEQITRFTLLKFLSESNVVPFFGDEQKFSGRLSHIAAILKDVLRSSYDKSSGSRGQKDQTVKYYEYRRSACVCGEHSLQETAIIERQIKIQISKLTTLKPMQTASFRYLKENEDLLGSLGKSILLEALKITDEEILQDLEKIEKLLEEKLK